MTTPQPQPQPSPSSASSACPSSYGRIVRLHFACEARLPIGSSLRVTSSQLWAPGSLTPSDPNDAHKISVKAHESALPDNQNQMEMEFDDTDAAAGCYASSVEMVTSPEDWPVWKTRKPVVIALRHHHGRVEQHRYRYLVVTPGVGNSNSGTNSSSGTKDEGMGMNGEEEEEGTGMGIGIGMDDTNHSLKNMRGRGSYTTSDDGTISQEVMAWEDPFQDSDNDKSKTLSAVSLPSVRRNAMSKTLANLPYRTLHIDTITATVQHPSNMDSNDDNNQHQAYRYRFTSDNIQIDTWNKGDDYSFYPYTLREQLNKQNKAKKLLIKQVTNTNNDTNSDTNSDANNAVSSNNDILPELQDTETNREVPVKLSSKVSFSNLVEISTSHHNEPFSSTTSLTVTPNISVHKHKHDLLTGPTIQTTNSPSDVSLLNMKSATSASTINTANNKKSKRTRIFFTCYHLPVNLTYDENANNTDNQPWSATWAESLLAATENSQIIRDYDAHWIGTISCPTHPIESPQDKQNVIQILAQMKCTPIFLDKQTQEAHYYGMCKQVLWPAFHNVDMLDLSKGEGSKDRGCHTNGTEWDQSRLDQWWKAYKDVNHAFADLLATILQPGDVMWVHDYHLSLLPKIMDDRERNDVGRSVTKKVFLLHIPFPTSQIFRELECGEEILKGMLHSDVVGFHAFDHARHFLAATKRILGLNHESLIGGLIGIRIGRRTILVSMHNVSVEPFQLDAALSLPSIAQYTAKLRQDHSSRKIIAGIDIAQRLSGISLKLLAFERLLTDYPVWQKKVVMVQKCLLPGSRRYDEANTIREVRQLVNRIKKTFGPHVIDYEEIHGSSVPIDQRLSLWKVSDVLMQAPIREGLNLLPLEYVYTKKKPGAPGVVISSEFSVVSNVLNGALRLNPFDIQMAVTRIDEALTMNEQEKEGRRFRDEAFVMSCTSSQWTKNVLNDLQDATAVTVGTDDEDSTDTSIMGTRFDKNNLVTTTAQFLAHEKEIAFSRLDIKSVVNAYNKTKNRVLILDLNGTIIIKEPPGKYLKREILGSSGFDVNPEVSKALTRLSADPRNTVFVVSGDSQENVVKAIGDVPGIGIAASNGACFSPTLKPDEDPMDRQWKYFDLGVDWVAVKKIVLPILAKYTARSNGSFVKLTHSSIGWSYYSCDPEWGSLQASHLVLELEHELRSFDVRFVMIKGIVEVVPRRLNKGLIAKNVLREVEEQSRNGNSSIDFILCMGDDIQDEKMFTSVFSFISEQDCPDYADPGPPVVDANGDRISASISIDGHEADKDHAMHDKSSGNEDGQGSKDSNALYAFTSVVGKKSSHAFTYVDDARDVSTLLLRLAGLNDSTLSDDAMAGIESC